MHSQPKLSQSVSLSYEKIFSSCPSVIAIFFKLKHVSHRNHPTWKFWEVLGLNFVEVIVGIEVPLSTSILSWNTAGWWGNILPDQF